MYFYELYCKLNNILYFRSLKITVLIFNIGVFQCTAEMAAINKNEDWRKGLVTTSAQLSHMLESGAHSDCSFKVGTGEQEKVCNVSISYQYCIKYINIYRHRK
jgi:hypothetical protein